MNTNNKHIDKFIVALKVTTTSICLVLFGSSPVQAEAPPENLVKTPQCALSYQLIKQGDKYQCRSNERESSNLHVEAKCEISYQLKYTGSGTGKNWRCKHTKESNKYHKPKCPSDYSINTKQAPVNEHSCIKPVNLYLYMKPEFAPVTAIVDEKKEPTWWKIKCPRNSNPMELRKGIVCKNSTDKIQYFVPAF